MVRISLRNVIYVFLTVLGIIYIYYLNHLGPKDAADETQLRTTSDGSKFENLPCVLNREVAKNIGVKQSNKSFQCKTDGSEIFVPFSFLSHQYEVRGNLVNNNRGKIIARYFETLYLLTLDLLQSLRSPSRTPRFTAHSRLTPPEVSSCTSRRSMLRAEPG